jgi:hypothetical protein
MNDIASLAARCAVGMIDSFLEDPVRYTAQNQLQLIARLTHAMAAIDEDVYHASPNTSMRALPMCAALQTRCAFLWALLPDRGNA